MQEKTAFFFCLEDRALLCRDCDVSIHTANTLSSNHQRFLVPGVRVALEALSGQEVADVISEEIPRPAPSTTSSTPSMLSNTMLVNAKPETGVMYRPQMSAPSYGSPYPGIPLEKERARPTGMASVSFGEQNGNSLPIRNSLTDFLSDAVPVWRVDEFLNLPELADGYNIGDIGSSKVCHILG